MSGGVRITRSAPAGALEPMSALGAAMAAAELPGAPATPATTALGAVLAGAATRVLRDVEVPGYGKAKLRLLDHTEAQEVNCELAAWLGQLETDRGIAAGALAVAGGMPIEAERARRTLARAARDPSDVARPFGTAAEWGQLPQLVIGAVWDSYKDLLEALDPFRADQQLDEQILAELADAFKKKDPAVLSTYGARTLAIWLLTTADPPAPSSTPR